MRIVVALVIQNWSTVFIPSIVFVVSLIALFWLRKFFLDWLEEWAKKTKWALDDVVVPSLGWPLSLLCIILSIYLGLAVSQVPDSWKLPLGNGLWTLFVAAIAFTLASVAGGMTLLYGRKLKIPKQIIFITRNVIRIVIFIVALLFILDIWGMPTSPLLILIAVIVLIAVVAFRDTAPNLFAGFQLAANQEIKAGDYIKLESGEEGHVMAMNWNTTRLRALDGNTVLVPNTLLVHRKVVNYGRPLKRAKQPFFFNTRAHLPELTGLKAGNLQELVDTLKKMPDEVIYYHTHRFLQEHQYLIPELSNDFAVWVKDAIGNESLAERIASVNTFEFRSLGVLRDRLVGIIEEYISQDTLQRDVIPGREFYFIKSVSVILPTAYVAHDLREFVEALRKISSSSLYFHIFESRLRLGSESNDLSFWLEKEMDEGDLAKELARIDPYIYSLEGLRSLLIQVIEKRIK